MLFQIADAFQGRRGDTRRHRGGKNKSRTVGADKITEFRRAGDITADNAERLGERSLDNGQAVRQTIAFADSAAPFPVQANGVNLVNKGHGPVFIGQITKFLDRRDVAVHGIDGFEGYQLRPINWVLFEPAFQIFRIVVFKNFLFRLGMNDSFDHGIVVVGIRQNHTFRQHSAQRTQRRQIRRPAGPENQGGFLAMQIGQFLFQQHMVMVGAGDVAGAAGAGAAFINRRFHGAQNIRVLSHS